MKWNYKLLAFLSNFGIGLSAPILILMLYQHGCTLQDVGFAVSIFATTVIILEIPTGIFADMYGRKISFIVSRLFGILSATFLLASRSFGITAIALVFMGLSTAFASGSLDALIFENSATDNGEIRTKSVSSFYAFQSAGIACGALIGGLLPFTEGYWLHLLIKCIIALTTGLVAFNLPYETKSKITSIRSAMTQQIQQMVRLLLGKQSLKSIVLCIIFIALLQSSLETYWQPQLSAFLLKNSQAVLGILASSAYIATSIGCALIGRFDLRTSKSIWLLYFGIAGGFISLIFLLSYALNVFVFGAIYVALYLFIGMISIPEQIIINRNVTNDVRASMMSVSSFAVRIGGMMSGILCSFLLIGGDISYIWRISAIITITGLAGVMVKRAITRPGR